MPVFSKIERIDWSSLQLMQDSFSTASKLASIMVDSSGTLLTKPNNFPKEWTENQSIQEVISHFLNLIPDTNNQISTTSTSNEKQQQIAVIPIIIQDVTIGNWLIAQSFDLNEIQTTATTQTFNQFIQLADILVKQSVKQIQLKLETEQIQNEFRMQKEELQLEKMLLNALLENIPDHIYFKDLDSRFIRSCRSQAKQFKLDDPKLVIGKTDFNFFSQEHAQMAFADEQRIIKYGITISKEEKETWTDRPDTWVSTTKAPLYDYSGNIIGTFGISRNVTEKKTTELELIKSEERFRTIIENMGEGIGVVDGNETFIFCNPAAESIFGVEQGTLEGRNLKDFVDDEEYQRITNETQHRILGKRSIYEIEIIRPDQEKRSVLLSSVPKIHNGRFDGTFGVFRDITERKEQERTIQNQNNELKEINSQKDKLLSIIAHDLRSPFSAFIGLTELLTHELKRMSHEDIQFIASNIKTSAIRIYDLLSNLLEWSRIQRGLIRPSFQYFLLIDAIQQCIDAVSDMLKEKSITLINLIPLDLEIKADPYIVQIVTQNLISNAIKFTPIEGTITVNAQTLSSGKTEISVQDTGIGMSQDMIDQIFEMNNDISRIGTNGEPSTGLGLLICKELIEKHNGEIRVTSQVEQGSSFIVTF